MDRAGKQEIIEDVSKTFADVVSVVLADFRGLNVATITDMRHEFKKAGCTYKVIKNTLLKMAVKDGPMEPMSALLTGPTAVIWSTESPSAPAKLAVKYARAQKAFQIKGGFFEGTVLDVAGVESLSRLPSKDECRASMLMTFLAAPQDLVRTMAAGPTNFLYLLQARERSMQG